MAIPHYREVSFGLTGVTPLLMHKDDVDCTDKVQAWRMSPKNNNKANKARGDDRSPPWTWTTYLYHDNAYVAMPSDNIMSMLRLAGSKIPNGKSNFKAISQSGIRPIQDYFEFRSNGKQLLYSQFDELRTNDELSYVEQKKLVTELGFRLKEKRARISKTAKHLRVRPEFDQWSVRGSIGVLDERLSNEILRQMFDIAGRDIGLCDWRPGGTTPGMYGTFSAELH